MDLNNRDGRQIYIKELKICNSKSISLTYLIDIKTKIKVNRKNKGQDMKKYIK